MFNSACPHLTSLTLPSVLAEGAPLSQWSWGGAGQGGDPAPERGLGEGGGGTGATRLSGSTAS